MEWTQRIPRDVSREPRRNNPPPKDQDDCGPRLSFLFGVHKMDLAGPGMRMGENSPVRDGEDRDVVRLRRLPNERAHVLAEGIDDGARAPAVEAGQGGQGPLLPVEGLRRVL